MTEEAIIKSANELAELFKISDLYKDYLRYKKALEEDPLLTERVAAYKKLQMALELKRLEHGTADFEEEKHVAHYYAELSLHPIAGPFLGCEHSLLDLYRQVFDIITDACEMSE